MKEGKCPFRPGDLKSKLNKTLDFKRLNGTWKVIYDESKLNDRFSCLGIKFIPQEDVEARKVPIDEKKFLEMLGNTMQTGALSPELEKELEKVEWKTIPGYKQKQVLEFM